jgi:hypothetical protein
MPFITLNNDWSNLARYYNNTNDNGNFVGTANSPNVTNTQKPTIPSVAEQFSLSDEGLIRGGVQNALLATTKDVIRVGRFIINPDGGDRTSIPANTGFERFVENIKGYLFFTKQVLLQRANPRLEVNKSNFLGGVAGFLGGATRTFTGAGMFASVGGNAFGLHFDRAGTLGIIPPGQKYGGSADSPTSGVVYSNNFNGDSLQSNLKITEKSNNRLLEYTAKLINNNSKNNEVVLDGYLGGPNSIYGIIGRTRTISYFDKTFITDSDIGVSSRETNLLPNQFADYVGFLQNNNTFNGPLTTRLNGFIPLTNKKISDYTPPADTTSLKTVLATSPFYTKSTTGKLNNSGSISNINIESRIGVSTSTNVDSINIINITDSKTFYETNAADKEDAKKTSEALSIPNVDGDYGKDLIKFRLEFLNNDLTGVRSTDGRLVPNTDVLAFRAYIDSFDDGIQAKWNSYNYMGRGEEFYVYNGFTRNISVAFTMFAHTRAEMAPLYNKLNYLLSTFAPDYSSFLKIRGNIGYLTVGNYIYRQPGVFTDIKIGNFFDGSWDVGINKDNIIETDRGQYDGNELPMMLKITLSFKPIHTFLPRKSKNDETKSSVPFIGRDPNAYPYLNPADPKNNPSIIVQGKKSGV